MDVKSPSRPMTGLRRPVPVSAASPACAPHARTDGGGASSPAPFSMPYSAVSDWKAWYDEHRHELAAALRERGAVLLRRTPIANADDFRRFCQTLSTSPMTYTERSSPRRELGDQVYTSTEYPADENIFLHNECSYSRTWPRALFFHCSQPADEGGETILCDSRAVYERLSAGLKRRFESHGVLYGRHYCGYLDLTWQTAFQTPERRDVERHCEAAGIEWTWTSSGGLKTRQIGQASWRHPETGEMVWFNQAHMFHVSALKPEYRAALQKLFAEADLPRHAYLGDGAPIEAGDLTEIRSVYESLQYTVRLEHGDILWLDNMLCAHGRRPFAGARHVAVIMADAMHASASPSVDA